MLKVEEEELSELQLRLLALQSASKKWQQKEQQVMKKSKDRITKAVQERSSSSGPSPRAPTPGRTRVTTRSASSSAAAAAAAAADRSRTRSKPLDRDRDRAKIGPRPSDRDRPPERDRPKQSLKPVPRTGQERGRNPGKPHVTKKILSPGEWDQNQSFSLRQTEHHWT